MKVKVSKGLIDELHKPKENFHVGGSVIIVGLAGVAIGALSAFVLTKLPSAAAATFQCSDCGPEGCHCTQPDYATVAVYPIYHQRINWPTGPKTVAV